MVEKGNKSFPRRKLRAFKGKQNKWEDSEFYKTWQNQLIPLKQAVDNLNLKAKLSQQKFNTATSLAMFEKNGGVLNLINKLPKDII